MLSWLLFAWIVLSFTAAVVLGLVAGLDRGQRGGPRAERRRDVELRDARLN